MKIYLAQEGLDAQNKILSDNIPIPIDTSSDIICPFCKEGDFDLAGLKNHYLRGWCDIWNKTETRR